MEEILVFIRARLDEIQGHSEQAQAIVGATAPWWEAKSLKSVMTSADARHVEFHSPERVLADIAAKRALLDVYAHADRTWDIVGGGFLVVEKAVRQLAAVWSDHPAYDPTWSPA